MSSSAEEIEVEIRSAFAAVAGGLRAKSFVVSDLFKESNNAPEGIRANDAVDAARRPAAVDRYRRRACS